LQFPLPKKYPVSKDLTLQQDNIAGQRKMGQTFFTIKPQPEKVRAHVIDGLNEKFQLV